MRTLTTVGLSLFLAVAVQDARAQRALGDGSALDGNLRQGSAGRNAPARNLEREFRLRNAIVTGRAAGPLNFRGDVGYSAPDDFRGELAEDDLFAFDRDSFFSTLTGQGVRGADALQMQMQLTIGGFVGEGDFLVDPVLERSQDATSSRDVYEARHLQQEFGSSDPLQYRRGALRSTSEYITRTAEAPVLLRVTPADEENPQPLYTIATPLRSLTEQPEVRPERRLTDLYQQIERIENRENNADETDLSRSNRIDTQIDTHREILERHLERRAEIEAAENAQNAEAPDDEANDEPEETISEDDLLDRFRELREGLMRPEDAAVVDPEEASAAATEALRQRISDDAQRLFEGGVIDVESLTPAPHDQNSLYAGHMSRGQELLAEGQWFAAEERFTSALGLRPGDPMAAVGRVHAQIGGGMFLSSGLNLQKLFRAHPELINVRYGSDLLPLGDRLNEIEALLLTRLRSEDDFSRGAALVQAYLGFQSKNAEWVERGLERAREIDEALDRTPDSLLDVLERAWTAE